ncbi:peptidylprolyl isomerase [bacterium]|nr:peptidylprolyl isomerase [bacterium]
MKKLSILFVMLFLFGCQTKEKFSTFLIETTEGNIKIKLYNETPKHRDNFIKLANEKFYENILFHRVIKDFMIQTGDPESKNATPEQQLGKGGPGYTIDAEFNPNLIHKRGAIAAARMPDMMNPEKKSSGSQFYIVTGKKYNAKELDEFEKKLKMFKRDQNFSLKEHQKKAYTTIGGVPHLDNDYTVFGEVIEGMDIVDKISNTKTKPGDRPLSDIKIVKIKQL